MKEEVYTAPANFKRGKLIVGSYKVSDLIIIGFLLEMYDYLIAQKVYPFEGVIHYDEEKNREETGERRYSWEEKDI